MDFDQLFKQIPKEETYDFAKLFMLTGKDFPVITAGKQDQYNSMVGGGGFGPLFKKPATWNFLRADRYTLELIQKEQTYTLSYFSNEYKEQVFFLASKSGRDSRKMKEVKLTSIQTPCGNISFEEARLIIECKLTIITTISPDDIYAKDAKDFVEEEYREESHYRKVVFGEITHVWVRK